MSTVETFDLSNIQSYAYFLFMERFLSSQKSTLSRVKALSEYTSFDKNMLLLHIFLAKYPHEVLGIPSNYSKRIALARYRLLQHLFHPDKNPTIPHEISAKLNKAWHLFEQGRGFVDLSILEIFTSLIDLLKGIDFDKLTEDQQNQLQKWLEESTVAIQNAQKVIKESQKDIAKRDLLLKNLRKLVELTPPDERKKLLGS